MGEGKENGKLARSIGLFALTVYGIGDMVGAGIYGTIGVAAGRMGNAVWMGFAVAMIAALLTGLTYASLASRYPKAAGAAFVMQRAYGWQLLAYVVGLAVVCSGLTSMAAGSRVFAATLAPLVGNPPFWIIFLSFLAVLTIVNLRGIRECVWVNMVCTAVEVGGLLFIIAVSVPYVGKVDYLETPDAGGVSVPLVLSGAVLTFYAFVGFEDLLNLSEEAKNPRRTMPLGIVFAVSCAAVIYMLVSVAAISVVPYRQLADHANGAPFAQITRVAAPWVPPHIYTGITLFAVANTALMNFIMGSRLIYGMSRQGLLPGALGVVNPSRHTPHVAILVLAGIVSILAFSGDIAELASATSLLLLLIFCLMNVALIILKRRPREEKAFFEVPLVVPGLGALVCAALIVSRLSAPGAGWRAPGISAVLLGAIVALYFAMRPRTLPSSEVTDA